MVMVSGCAFNLKIIIGAGVLAIDRHCAQQLVLNLVNITN